MAEGITTKLLLLVLMPVLSALFAGSEAAILSSQRTRVHHLVSIGVPGAGTLAKLLDKPERLLSIVLLANTITISTSATLATAIAISLAGDSGLALFTATSVVTVLLLIFGGVTPTVIGARWGERLAVVLAPPIHWSGILFYPLVRVFEFFGQMVSRIAGGSPRALVTEEEIGTMILVGRRAGAVEQSEPDMISRVFRFGDPQVREVMTPRTEVEWVEEGTTLSQFLAPYQRQPFSRYPRCQGGSRQRHRHPVDPRCAHRAGRGRTSARAIP